MEMIMAVPRRLLIPYLTREKGLILGCERELYALIEKEHSFLPRDAAENDPAYKQIIPYITLCRGEEVFSTRRLSKGGEQRLHGKLSLGLGGHINALDDDSPGIFRRGLYRELGEEAFYTPVGELVPRGVINDDTTEVGQVHLGFFFTLEVSDAAVRETEKLTGEWLKKAELPALAGQMESWSEIIIPAL